MKISKIVFCTLLFAGVASFAQPQEAAHSKKDWENKMTFFTIMPFIPSDVPFMVKEYKRFSEATGLKLLLPSMTLQPEGENPYDKADFFIKAFAELQKGLEGTDIKLGILLQSLVGHGYATSPKQNIFQTTVGHNGKTRGRICMLDPNFRKYCDYTVSSLAKLHPETFLLDDDTRTIDGDILECFCPLHMAKLSQPYTREERVTHLKQGASDPVFQEFETLRRSTLENFCRAIRQAIDKVDPSIPCGISGPGAETPMYERMALAAAGGTTPFVRMGNHLYFEQSPHDLTRRFYYSAVQKNACKNVKLLLDESDTFPHNLYSKSSTGMFSHITAAILLGARGAKVWISDYLNPKAGEPNAAFEKRFRDNLGFFDELVRTVAVARWQGPAVPLPDPAWKFDPMNEDQPYRYCQEWFSDFLGRVGIPCDFTDPNDPQPECFLLTGELVRLLSDRELTAVVQKNLILDGRAAEYLQEKGYGDLLGLRVEKDCPHFSFEQDVASGRRMRLSYTGNARKLIPVPGAKVLSMLRRTIYSGCLDTVEVAPGSVRFRNAKNREVFVWAGALENYTVCDERQQWFLTATRGMYAMPYSVNAHQDAFVRCGTLTNGAVLLTIFNLNFDVMENPPIIGGKIPQKVWKLAPDGKWQEIDFRAGANRIVPEIKVGVYEPAVLKIK